MNLLANKVAIITGAGRGIGRAIALKYAQEGASVVITDLKIDETVEAFVKELEGLGVKAKAYASNAANFEDAHKLVEAVVADFGRIDVLVNNAGVWLTCSVGTITERDWDLSIDVNLKAPMLLSQMFVEHCTGEGRTGRILNVTSQAAFRGSSTGHIPYAAAKGGLVTLTRSMARELGPCGVTVNAIAIGMMDSPMVAKALEERREYYEAKIPIGYVAAPADIADIAVFLVSERAKYMTGATVDVSGGQLMH